MEAIWDQELDLLVGGPQVSSTQRVLNKGSFHQDGPTSSAAEAHPEGSWFLYLQPPCSPGWYLSNQPEPSSPDL